MHFRQYPETRESYFRKQVKASGKMLRVVHVAKIIPSKVRKGEALVTLHDAGCERGFTFTTSLEMARDHDELAGFLERVYCFSLKETPRDCTHLLAKDG